MLFTAPYIRDGKPSWISGEENAILPYRLFVRNGKTGVISPSGQVHFLTDDSMEKCLCGNVNGIIMGRLSHSMYHNPRHSDEWKLFFSLTERPIEEKPHGGEGSVWIGSDGDFAQNLGEMTRFDLITTQKTKSTVWGMADGTPLYDVWQAGEPIANYSFPVERIYSQQVDGPMLIVRGEVEEVTIHTAGKPFTGMIFGRGRDIMEYSMWEDGRFVRHHRPTLEEVNSLVKTKHGITAVVKTNAGVLTKNMWIW